MNDYISFPAMNLEFPISPTIVEFQLFGMDFSLKWYGLMIAIGFLLAVIYAVKRAKHFNVDPDRMIDVTLVSALFAFLGARLYFVFFSSNLASYLEDPISIFAVWEGGLAIYGGIIFGFIAAFFMCRVRKVNMLAMFDIAALGFLIGQGIGRWGNFFNQEAFGSNTTLPWGMSGSIIQQGFTEQYYDPTLPVHPTFLYESLWCLLGLILLHVVSKKAYKFKGEIFSLYIMWYGAGRFFIEGLRTDSLYLGNGGLRVSQLVAVLSVIGGLALFFLLRARHNQLPKELFAEETAHGGTVPVNETLRMDEESIEDIAEDDLADASEEAVPTEETDTTSAEDTEESDFIEDTADSIPDEAEETDTDEDTDTDSTDEIDL